jgi:hypothetical protein
LQSCKDGDWDDKGLEVANALVTMAERFTRYREVSKHTIVGYAHNRNAKPSAYTDQLFR